jgi:hypothetical protein
MKSIIRMFRYITYNTHDGHAYLYPYTASTHLGGRNGKFHLMHEELCRNIVVRLRSTLHEINL